MRVGTGPEVATVYAAGASGGAPSFSAAGDLDPAARRRRTKGD